MTCEAWDVVTVPFPFTDRAAQKRRPALVLSQKSFNRQGHTLMAMITSAVAPWPSDTSIRNISSAGLSQPCVVRPKLFTLDSRLILRRIGQLADEDRQHVSEALRAILPF